MRTAQLLAPIAIVAAGILLAGCAGAPLTTEQSQKRQEAQSGTPAEETPELATQPRELIIPPPLPPHDASSPFTQLDIIAACIDKTRTLLADWDDTDEKRWGGNLWIREGDAHVDVGADGQYYVTFPNVGAPGYPVHCRSVNSDAPAVVSSYQDIVEWNDHKYGGNPPGNTPTTPSDYPLAAFERMVEAPLYPMPNNPQPPTNFSPEEFISACIDHADNTLHFWSDYEKEQFGGGLHIRARDVNVVYVGGDNRYFAKFPNLAAPGNPLFCSAKNSAIVALDNYYNQGGWFGSRGPHSYEVGVQLEGDAYYRVSQDPDISWQSDPTIQ